MNSGSLDLISLWKMASKPKDKNTFAINSYDELKNIHKQLADRICAVAGMENEMSWKRFSLAFYQVSTCCCKKKKEKKKKEKHDHKE